MKTYVDNFPPYSRNTSCDLRKQTNADRIRAMSDEELADWLCHIVSNEVVNCSHCIAEEYCKMGRNGFKEWLKQEADNV